jgi:hypothetical protein
VFEWTLALEVQYRLGMKREETEGHSFALIFEKSFGDCREVNKYDLISTQSTLVMYISIVLW